MNYDELIKVCKPLSVSGKEPKRLGKLRQDSREVKPGDIFIAISGTKADGHDFIDEAIDRGAAVIISEKDLEEEDTFAALRVKNTRKLLGPLAQKMAGNPADQLTVIGITGTNGKTTVATLIWQLLTRLNHKASLLGTVETRILKEKYKSRLTTADPIELAEQMRKMVDAGSRYLVMEVSSHAIDQKRVRGIRFNIGIFTNLSHDHLDYHPSMSDYASTKKKMFNKLGSDSWAITNADDERGEWIVNSTPAKVLSFSFKGKGLIQATILESDATGMRISVDETEFRTPLVGRFNAYNVVEALLACTVLGIDGSKAGKTIPICKGAPGRMERVNNERQIDDQPIIFVDYAHTPDALKNVLSTLKELKEKNQELTVIFGCGGDRDKSKRPEMAGVAESLANNIIVTSDNPRTENPDEIIDDILLGFTDRSAVNVISSRETAIRKGVATANAGSIVMIAGKGHETYQEINGERIDFDDREIAADALKRRDNLKQDGEVV
ncbi:MAG: UDP-N-acetylmuramoyl-L-alanyl-D-glutamate--2,6-diaminopimelate ligase [Balneolaceae bacterium]|nr:UDP-N-acetylmuramoyl-L-alanyl-D-glutamate--2,6-diaminopimelate ligase [Balneolaceae bacterium]